MKYFFYTPKMLHRTFLCVFWFLFEVSSNPRDLMILDYFAYKNVSSVVGISCNTIKDDIVLIKNFNNIGMSSVMINPIDQQSIEIYAKSIYWRIGIFMDIRCNNERNIASILSKAADHSLYDELHYWLIVGSKLEDILDIIDDDSFGMSTDFVIAVAPHLHLNDSYELYDAYNIWKKRGTPLNLTYMGSWNRNNRFHLNFDGPKYYRRANLLGLTMRASFFFSRYKPANMPLEDYLQDYSTYAKDGLSKYGFAIVTHLSEMFNFTLKCGTVKWENGDATGPIIRALANDEIDLSGCPATMNVKRTYLVRYVHQSRPFRTCFMFRNPQPKSIKVNEVLGPLDIQVWYYTLLLFGVTIWVLATLYKYEESRGTITRYSEAILTISGAICQQSSNIEMGNMSTRIAYLHIMIFTYLLYNYYSASIVSARLSEPIYKMNDSLSSLAKSGLKVSSEWMAYFELFIKKKDWETQTFYTNVWLKLPESEQFISPEKGMQLVKGGGFAYHVHPDVAYPFVNRFFDNREICELMEVHLASPTYSTFAVSRNSTFTEMMRVGLQKIAEVGLRRRQLQRWSSNKPQCLKSILSASSIDIYEFGPHLVLLFLGFVVALGIFLLEMTNRRKLRNMRSRTLVGTERKGKGCYYHSSNEARYSEREVHMQSQGQRPSSWFHDDSEPEMQI